MQKGDTERTGHPWLFIVEAEGQKEYKMLVDTNLLESQLSKGRNVNTR